MFILRAVFDLFDSSVFFFQPKNFSRLQKKIFNVQTDMNMRFNRFFFQQFRYRKDINDNKVWRLSLAVLTEVLIELRKKNTAWILKS